MSKEFILFVIGSAAMSVLMSKNRLQETICFSSAGFDSGLRIFPVHANTSPFISNSFLPVKFHSFIFVSQWIKIYFCNKA